MRRLNTRLVSARSQFKDSFEPYRENGDTFESVLWRLLKIVWIDDWLCSKSGDEGLGERLFRLCCHDRRRRLSTGEVLVEERTLEWIRVIVTPKAPNRSVSTPTT